MSPSSRTVTPPDIMYPKCIKCGSERTHHSRVRPGERTLGMLFLRPVRCRQCKERFWVKNPNAFLALGGALFIGALLITTVWLIIEHNMTDPYMGSVAETGTQDPVDSAVPATSKPRNDQEALRSPAPGTRRTHDIPQSSGSITPSAPARNPMEDHHFTVRLYQEAAINGDADSQYKLGLLYLTGNGALQDFAEAAKWLQLAAEQGYGPAQYELGLIYRNGYGLPADPMQSYVWLNLAAAAGVQQAIAARDEVMRALSSKQLAQAQKISREWLAARTGLESGKEADRVESAPHPRK
ncbi:MAG: SEL1-like repeat protein [Nitrosospira multiformis]|nr:SEL1-like repeat protein [Nitrosospira multiformis]